MPTANLLPNLPAELPCAAVGTVDANVSAFFQERLTAPVARVFETASRAADEPVVASIILLALAFLAWRKHWSRMALLLVAAPGGMILGELLKLVIQRQRPVLSGPFVTWSGYSFPSGHALGATLLYGVLLLAVLPLCRTAATRYAAIATAVLTILMVALSRVVLGAHYVTDVLAGIAFGIAWLWLCVKLANVLAARRIQPAPVAEQSPAADHHASA